MLGFNTPIIEVTTETLDDLVASLKQDGIANGTIHPIWQPCRWC